MKKAAILIILALLLLSAAAFAWQLAYDVPWWTVDSGAETSTGGDFSLSGISGQPDAGSAMDNGEYSLTGGYWPAGEQPAPAGSDVFLPLLVR